MYEYFVYPLCYFVYVRFYNKTGKMLFDSQFTTYSDSLDEHIGNKTLYTSKFIACI